MGNVTVSTEFDIVLSYFYLCLMIISSLVNISLLLVLISPFHQRRYRDYVLISLCLADLVRILFSGSEEFKGLSNHGKVFKDHNSECQAVALVAEVFEIVSICHMLLLVLDRYLCACQPRVALKMYGRRRYVFASIFNVYFYAIFWSVLPFFGLGQYGLQANMVQCGLRTTNVQATDKIYITLLLIAIFVIPLVFIILFAYKISTKIKEKSILQKNFPNQNEILCYIKQDADQIKLIVAVTVVFLLTWLPYDIILAKEIYTEEVSESSIYAELVTGFLGHSSALLMPLTYILFYKDLQDTILVIKRKFCKKRRINGNSKVTSASRKETEMETVFVE